MIIVKSTCKKSDMVKYGHNIEFTFLVYIIYFLLNGSILVREFMATILLITLRVSLFLESTNRY